MKILFILFFEAFLLLLLLFNSSRLNKRCRTEIEGANMQNTNEMPEQSTDTAEAPNRSSHSTYVNAAYPSDGHTPTSISGSKGSQNNLNTSDGSKKKADIFPLMKFKKRPISGVLNQDSELSW